MENRLLTIRKRLGMSQAQLANALGMTAGNVSHIETGRQILTLENAAALISVSKKSGISIGLDDIFVYQKDAKK